MAISDHISFGNVKGKLEVNWHVKCRECKKDITAFKGRLPKTDDEMPADTTTAAFQCPNDGTIEIITTADIYDELTRFQEKQ